MTDVRASTHLADAIAATAPAVAGATQPQSATDTENRSQEDA